VRGEVRLCCDALVATVTGRFPSLIAHASSAADAPVVAVATGEAFFELRLAAGVDNIQVGWTAEAAFAAMVGGNGVGVGDVDDSWGIVVGSRAILYSSGEKLYPVPGTSSQSPATW
jgi:hypothetical protein